MTNNTGNKLDFSEINVRIAENIEQIYDKLNIHHIVNGNRVSIACPYHLGSKDTSLQVYKDRGNIVCWTRHCEVTNSKWILNLIAYILKKSLFETVKWVESLLNLKFDELDETCQSALSFKRIVETLTKSKKIHTTIDREYVRKSLQIPSISFIKRGFNEQILIDYDVGFCNTRGREMYLRDTVPVYSVDNYLIGAMGRTINKKCSICDKYHMKNRMCPTSDPIEQRWSSKWINSNGFSTGSYLYNWNVASKTNSKNLIIVEGCGDCYKLIEAGYSNCVGLFGCKLTDEHRLLIESSAIENVYLCLDNDTSGIEGTVNAIDSLSRYYNIKVIKPENSHDWGEMNIETIKKTLKNIQ